MSGIQKILHAECEGFFVCSQPFCRQSVSISLFVSTFLQAECMGKLCCNLRLLISLVLVRNLVRDVVTLNLQGFEKGASDNFNFFCATAKCLCLRSNITVFCENQIKTSPMIVLMALDIKS